jgi:hypothetical protein
LHRRVKGGCTEEEMRVNEDELVRLDAYVRRILSPSIRTDVTLMGLWRRVRRSEERRSRRVLTANCGETDTMRER